MARDPEGNSSGSFSDRGGHPESVDGLDAEGNLSSAGRLSRVGLIAYGGVCGAFIGASTAIGLGSNEAEKAAIASVVGTCLGAFSGRRYAEERR